MLGTATAATATGRAGAGSCASQSSPAPRKAANVAAGSQPSTDLEAVQARHEHVQHHQVRLNLERLAQTFAAIRRQRDLIALVGQRPP